MRLTRLLLCVLKAKEKGQSKMNVCTFLKGLGAVAFRTGSLSISFHLRNLALFIHFDIIDKLLTYFASARLTNENIPNTSSYSLSSLLLLSKKDEYNKDLALY